MPGLNTTGTPNTRDYNLGRGIIRLAALGADGLPDANGFRDLGNAPEFTLSVTVEDLRHQSSREQLKFTDKRFVISQEAGISFQLDEINFQNLALFVSGTTSTYDNPHDTTWATTSLSVISTAVKLGNWYELFDDGTAGSHGTARVYNLDATGVVYAFEEDPTGTPVTLAEGVDFELDKQMGLVRFLPTSILVVDGNTVGWRISTGATTPQDLDQVNALKTAEVTGALVFISINAGDAGQKTEFRFHKVSLSSDGDFAMIGDEVTVMNFTGVAEVNNAVPDTSKVLTVRTYDQA